ncbi:hypothetical protein PMI42_03076 [Bradyrhizobium sp. YR681]|nr:hypothetical protein PMI42_03076 [Bradyrhizobium sp. YR681]
MKTVSSQAGLAVRETHHVANKLMGTSLYAPDIWELQPAFVATRTVLTPCTDSNAPALFMR